MPIQFAYQYAAAFLNKRISASITTQNYARSAFLYLLAGVTGGLGGDGTELTIGRPNEGMYLSGAAVDEADRESVRGILSVTQRIQAFKTSNTQVTGPMGTMPNVQNPTTNSQDLASQASAEWRWTINIDTPIYVWNSTLQLAMAKATADNGVAVGTLLKEANQVAMEEHIDNVNSRLIYGAPSVQDAEFWDDISGVISALLPTNRYAKIDRTNLPAGSPWLPQYVSSSFPLDVTRITDYANTILGANVFGGGITAILTGGPQYLVLKNQALARDKGGYVISNAGTQGLPGYAKVGMTREVVRCNNTFIMHEPFLDVCYGTDRNGTALYTAQPGYAICVNLKQWKWITHPDKSMKVEEMVDLHNKSVSAPDGSQSFIRTWGILQCMRPAVNALFTTLS